MNFVTEFKGEAAVGKFDAGNDNKTDNITRKTHLHSKPIGISRKIQIDVTTSQLQDGLTITE